MLFCFEPPLFRPLSWNVLGPQCDIQCFEMSLKGGTQVLSQFHNIVRWFYHATPPGHPIIPASQWRCRCILFVFGGQERGGRGRRTHRRRPAHFTRAKTLPNWSGRRGGSPIKKCSRKRAAHCHWVHFVSLSSWHRNSSCGEAAAYPQAMHGMWHFGCKAVRPPPPLCRSNRSRRPSWEMSNERSEFAVPISTKPN